MSQKAPWDFLHTLMNVQNILVYFFYLLVSSHDPPDTLSPNEIHRFYPFEFWDLGVLWW